MKKNKWVLVCFAEGAFEGQKEKLEYIESDNLKDVLFQLGELCFCSKVIRDNLDQHIFLKDGVRLKHKITKVKSNGTEWLYIKFGKERYHLCENFGLCK